MKRLNTSCIILFFIVIIFLTIITTTNIKSLANVNENEMSTMKSNIKFISESNGVKEYLLSNKLKILLKPLHNIPLVTFSIWYRVGSRNETDNIRGIAHFLEHMMFKGTKKYKKGEISAIIQGHGGIFNAFTSQDCTGYYETISPKYLEKVIEIEADRMNGSILDENELNLERTVILSELEGDLNNPSTLLDQKVRSLAYEISPYKHPTIGYENDIKSVNSKIMHDFYKKHYSPNNAFIVLIGDFDEQVALNLIKKYFGNIKNRNDITQIKAIQRDKKQLKEKRITVKRAGSFKILEIAYHISDVKNKDIYPLNIIEELLLKRKSSSLNKKLIEKGLATEIYGGAESNTDPGLFYILISLTPKATHKAVEKIVLNEIKNLIKTPPSEEELSKAKNRIKANYLFNLDGTFGQVFNIGYFEAINNWKESQEWTKNISKVTREDVLDVLKKYFNPKNKTIGYFIPKMSKDKKYEPLPLTFSRTHNFKKVEDKGQPLAPRASLAHSVGGRSGINYTKQKLNDGSSLLIYKNIDLPITYISGVIKGGTSLVPKEKEWACELIARLLEKGSKNYSKEKVEEILDSLGTNIDFSCDEESFKFNAVTLNENLTQTLDLLFDLLLNPQFLESEVKQGKDKLVAEIIELKTNTTEIAKRAFTQLIYPKTHPYYLNNFGEDISQIKKIRRNTLVSLHEKIIRQNKMIIGLVSDLNESTLKNITNNLNNKLLINNKKIDVKVNIPDTLPREYPKTQNIKVQDKPQSDVFLGHAGNIKRTDPDFYKILLANYILGGSSLASRLSKTVRDNSGLVYTVYSYVNASHGKGEFGIYFGSNNENVDKAINLIKTELTKFASKGITENELKKAKNSLIDSFISRNLSTYRDITNTIVGIEFYNLGKNYISDYPKIINSLSLAEINNAIRKTIFPDKLNISIAGEYKASTK